MDQRARLVSFDRYGSDPGQCKPVPMWWPESRWPGGAALSTNGPTGCSLWWRVRAQVDGDSPLSGLVRDNAPYPDSLFHDAGRVGPYPVVALPQSAGPLSGSGP